MSRRTALGEDGELRRVRQRVEEEPTPVVRACSFCALPSCHSARHCEQRDLYNFWLRCHTVKREVIATSSLPMDVQCIKMLTLLDRPSDLLAAREFAKRYCDEWTPAARNSRAFDDLTNTMVFVLDHSLSFFDRRQMLPKVDCFAEPIPDGELQFHRFMVELMHSSLQFAQGYQQRLRLRDRLLENIELVEQPSLPQTDDCPICLESLPLERCVQLEDCKHQFCVRCFSKMVKSSACYTGCAMCRAPYGRVLTFHEDVADLLLIDMSM